MDNDFKTTCGSSGDWRIESFTIDPNDPKMMMENLRTPYYRRVRPGTYYCLIRGNTTVMSTTHAELYDLTDILNNATGHVLINGLGLGILPHMLLKKPDVTKITIIEISEDVIKLTGPLFKDNPKVEIIQANCFDYKPPKGIKYGYVWHDIWDYICSDNLEEMAKLHRKYGRKCLKQASWCKSECLRHKRQNGLY